jgi:hypothetical protein
MTSIERNDLMPTPQVEWVTPKISLMEPENTAGNKIQYFEEGGEGSGPS